VFLSPGSAIVLTGEARYDWALGSEREFEDLVQGEDGKV
jgi:alkylated DNA repair dioxygenase AlkB